MKLFPSFLKKKLSCISMLVVITVFLSNAYAQQKPADFFGFRPGTDGNLFTYEELIEYLEKLDTASSRMKMVEIGHSPEGRPMYIAFISSEENIEDLDMLRQINKKLALDPAIPEQGKAGLIKEGKVFVLGTLSMHSTEVGPSQSSALIAYNLVTTDDPHKLKWLDDVVYMMVPCHNPDGMDIVVDHYQKFKGTKYEGSSVPRVYHKYVGHDNNRDFVTLTQEDTRVIARIYNSDWYPQVMVEKHQMGSTGVRYFVPPVHDPIAENVDAGIWQWAGIFGSAMAKDMTRDGLQGVSQHYLYDDYWPGSTETCLWKNVIGMLTEGASAKMATPVYIEPNELRVTGKGLSEYKKSINMPDPWPGGWWRLSDIIDYEISSTMSILKTASLHRSDILKFRNNMAVREVHKGKTMAPFYYIMPATQHDPGELVQMVNLLKEHGVRVYTTSMQLVLDGLLVEKGSVVIPLAQPFRAFIKEVLEDQEFPARHYTPGGEMIKPYDITSWSLPLHMGVKCWEIDKPYLELESKLSEITGLFDLRDENPQKKPVAVFNVNHNESYKAAFLAMGLGLEVSRLEKSTEIDGVQLGRGSFVIASGAKIIPAWEKLIAELRVEPMYMDQKPASSLVISMPRIALVETNFSDMDAGWTRYVFDTYNIPFKVVKPGDFSQTDFSSTYDLVVFPNNRKSILMNGKLGSEGSYTVSSLAPEFTKGIGTEGMKKLMAFVDHGGTIISWGESTSLFEGILSIYKNTEKNRNNEKESDKEEFQLPFKDISPDLSKAGLSIPGSLVKIKLKPDHHVTLGMPGEVGVFYRGRPVFQTSVPDFDIDRRVLGITPEKDLLLSGYMEGEKHLGNRSLLLWMKKGRGQFVIFGFNPQFRSSTHATYKLLFNSLLIPEIPE